MITNNVAYLYMEPFSQTFPETHWDREIPVIPWMMIPYCGLYVFYPLVAFLAPCTEKGRLELLIVMQMLLTATLICCTIFMIFPTEVALRDEIDWSVMDPISKAFFKFVHNGDKPFNAFPSLHVIHSYVVVRTITQWCRTDYAEKAWVKPTLVALWVEWVLLVISTMTTKQHYIFDAATGLILGLSLWRWWDWSFRRIESKGADAILDYLRWDPLQKRSIEVMRLTEWKNEHADDHIDV